MAVASGLPPVRVVDGAVEGFRHRARLAIRGRQGAPKLGMFQLGTHSVVTIPRCRVHHPLVNHVAAVVRQALVDADVPIYADGPHRGVARYLQVVVERSSQTAQVVLVANRPSIEPLEACFTNVRDRLGPQLHSLWFNAQCERANAILGPAFHAWCGPASVVEHFGGPAIHYPPGAFGQNNLEIAGRIVERIREHVPDGARVTEFYGGVGAIGLSLLPRLGSLRINEVSPQSLRGLELGLEALEPSLRTRVDVVAGPAGENGDAAEGADAVIVDPPRKGLDLPLVERLAEHPPERLVYVSCGLESFLADARGLQASKRLRLAALEAFNLMPYTGHVETVALFVRT